MRRLAIFLLLVPIAVFAIPYGAAVVGFWFALPLVLVAALMTARLLDKATEAR